MIGKRWERCPFCGEIAPFSVGSRTWVVALGVLALLIVLSLIGYLIAVFFT